MAIFSYIWRLHLCCSVWILAPIQKLSIDLTVKTAVNKNTLAKGNKHISIIFLFWLIDFWCQRKFRKLNICAQLRNFQRFLLINDEWGNISLPHSNSPLKKHLTSNALKPVYRKRMHTFFLNPQKTKTPKHWGCSKKANIAKFHTS